MIDALGQKKPFCMSGLQGLMGRLLSFMAGDLLCVRGASSLQGSIC